MARTVTEIQKTITDAYVTNMAAISITVDTTTWSATDLQRLFIYVIAFCTFTLETLFDVFTADNNAAIAAMKPHKTKWYATMALAFQYGYSLLPDSDQFDNGSHTDAEIEDSKIIDYAAVVEQENNFRRVFLRIKVAHDNGTDLEPISDDEKTAFSEYMAEIKDAGVPLIIDSLDPDSIKQTWKIFYNPLVLNSEGARIDGSSSTPVQDAIKNYLKNLPFNGVYAPQYHIDAVQSVDGVVLCDLLTCEKQFGLLPFSQVVDTYTPDAGYLRFDSDDDLVITFIPQSPIK